MTEISWILVGFIILLPSIAIHEYAHGKVADLLGDPTPKYHNRLTLNPIAHIDLFGTIIIPLLLLMMGSIPFGYAKPVPVNPNFFRERKKGMAITGMAGPLANFSIAAIIGILFKILPYMRIEALNLFAQINIFLGVFNLVPIPPLDGSKVLSYFIPGKYVHYLTLYEHYGMIFLFIFVFTGLYRIIVTPIYLILYLLLVGG
jgi:Zn-dependent protease